MQEETEIVLYRLPPLTLTPLGLLLRSSFACCQEENGASKCHSLACLNTLTYT